MFRTTLAALALIAAAGMAQAQTQSPTTPGTRTPDTGTMPGGKTTPGPNTPDRTAAPTNATSAKAAIEAKGYTGVKGLSRDSAGNWSAKATRNNTEVAVVLDANGNVREQ
jgi:hypothetical protein